MNWMWIRWQCGREHFPTVAGFEIYDLLVLDGTHAICPAGDRLVAPDIHAMARSYYEAAKSLHAEISERGRAEARVPV